VLPFVWLEKKHNNKIFTGLCKEKVCWCFRDPDACSIAKLSQQHFCPLLACGCYGHIPSPFFATTTRKNDESIKRPQRKKKKSRKGGPIIRCLYVRVSC